MTIIVLKNFYYYLLNFFLKCFRSRIPSSPTTPKFSWSFTQWKTGEVLRLQKKCWSTWGTTEAAVPTMVKHSRLLYRIIQTIETWWWNHVIFFAVRIHGVDRAVILVGNKVDLQRCRVVTPKGKHSNRYLKKFLIEEDGVGSQKTSNCHWRFDQQYFIRTAAAK